MDRPEVTVTCSASLDGRLAPARESSSRPFLSEVPEVVAEELDELRGAVDAVAVGNGTILQDDSRLLPSSGPPPLRVIIDPEGELSTTHTVLADEHPTAVAVTETTDSGYRQRVESRPAKRTIQMGREPDLAALLDELAAAGVERLLVEGGGGLIYHFLDARLVDECRILYLPLFVGEEGTVCLCDGPESLFPSVRLDVTRRDHVGSHTLLEGAVVYE